MYFDDVSRYHSVEWDPASDRRPFLGSSSSNFQGGGEEPYFTTRHKPVGEVEETTTHVPVEAEQGESARTAAAATTILHFPSYADQKKAALERMILGYDAKLASKLSVEEGTRPQMDVVKGIACFASMAWLMPHARTVSSGVVPVVEQTELWSRKAGVVGRSMGDELYGRLLGTSVGDARDAVTALSQLWIEISNVIRTHADDFSPTQSATSSTAAGGAAAAVIGGSLLEGGVGREAEKVHFVVFPACHELYDYKTMVTFVTAVEFAKEHCLHVGKRLTVGIFYPNYKHSPKLMSPERHSPFPTVALQLEDVHTSMRLRSVANIPKGHDAKPKRQRGNHVVVRRTASDSDDDDDDDDEKLAQLAYGKIHDLEGQRNVFEVLFNSAAVPGSDGHPVGRISKVDVVDEASLLQENGDHLDSTGILDANDGKDHALARTFRLERQLRRRSLTDTSVKDICRNWMRQNRFVDRARRKENRALRYMDTIDDARWTVSSEKIAEMEYAKIWTVISDLWEVGQSADRAGLQLTQSQRLQATKTIVNATASDSIDPSPAARDDHSQPSNSFPFIFLAFANNRAASPPAEKPRPSEIRRPAVVESSVLVSTKFCAFNAPAFKRFAITVNAVLKRFTKGRMFLEVFHNEYVGQEGFDPSLRRSPFPMIQVSYVVNATSSN
jgi:hypothetical protein